MLTLLMLETELSVFGIKIMPVDGLAPNVARASAAIGRIGSDIGQATCRVTPLRIFSPSVEQKPKICYEM